MARQTGPYDRADIRIVAQGTRALAAGETAVLAAIDRMFPGECFRVNVWLRAGAGAIAIEGATVAGDGVAYRLRRSAGAMELVATCGTSARQIDYLVEGVS